MKISHVSAVCRNRKSADGFYRDLLGFSKVKDFSIEADLTEKIFSIACPCQIVVYSHEGDEVEVFIPEVFPEERNPYTHICLEVADKQSFMASCQKSGIQINKIAKGDKFLTFIKDFDGNLFEVKEKVKV